MLTKEQLVNTKVKIPNQEISEKVQKKLFELGFNWIDGTTVISKYDFNYFYIEKSITGGIYEDTFDSYKLKEISFMDIIGDDFNWFIKRTKENWFTINEYCNTQYDKDKSIKMAMTTSIALDYYPYVFCKNNFINSKSDKPSDCIEITFDEFKKYVLKMENKKKYTISDLKKNYKWIRVTSKDQLMQLFRVINKVDYISIWKRVEQEHYPHIIFYLYDQSGLCGWDPPTGNTYGWEVIDFDQVIFENESNMNNKENNEEIIGYKFKGKFKHLSKSAWQIAYPHSEYGSANELEKYLRKENYGEFKINLEKAGVLDLWFEPIYKDQEVTFKIAEHTGKFVKVEGTKDYKFLIYDKYYGYSDIAHLYTYTGIPHVHSINIGCSGQYKVTRSELKQLLDIWDKLRDEFNK